MKFRCSFLGEDRQRPLSLVVTASNPLEAAELAVARHSDTPFSAVEVWDGTTRLLTWLCPRAPRRVTSERCN